VSDGSLEAPTDSQQVTYCLYDLKNNQSVDVDVVVISVLWRQSRCLSHELCRESGGSQARLVVRMISVLNEKHQDGHAGEVISDFDENGLLTLWAGGNLGYGGGNNIAVEWALHVWSPRYFLILNPDVLIDIAALETLVAYADSQSELGLLGPLQQVQNGGRNVLRRGMRYFKPLSILKSVTHPDSRTDYLNGGALLIRSSALMREKPFADDYFLFFEELEICERFRRRGYRVEVCEKSRVVHHEGGSRGSHHDDYAPEVAEYFENLNALRFTRRNCPWWLPSVLLTRLIAKPAVLIVRRDFLRFRFWWLAVKDFIFSRVRRFPFQAGWNPVLKTESLIDSAWPDFAKVRRG
jgi:GT2 family glycosyltransferase